MGKLALLIYVIVAPTLAGIAMVVVLVIGADTGNPVMLSVLVGALVAIPVSWLIAKKLSSVKGLMKGA
ncbi:MAG TPA: CTP synthetase [Rhizobiales bacterium]|nr:CTP synthetase [Hyphomicrobiales bacterium]